MNEMKLEILKSIYCFSPAKYDFLFMLFNKREEELLKFSKAVKELRLEGLIEFVEKEGKTFVKLTSKGRNSVGFPEKKPILIEVPVRKLYFEDMRVAVVPMPGEAKTVAKKIEEMFYVNPWTTAGMILSFNPGAEEERTIGKESVVVDFSTGMAIEWIGYHTKVGKGETVYRASYLLRQKPRFFNGKK